MKRASKLLRKGQGGFTLIELLAVMAILAVLVAIVAPAVTGSREASIQAQALQDATQVRSAASKFFGEQNEAEVRTPHTVTTRTLLPAASGTLSDSEGVFPTGVAVTATQSVSSKWPEVFITLGATPSVDVMTIGAKYSDVVHTVNFVSPKVAEVVLIDKKSKTIAGEVFLERFAAIDLAALTDAGFLQKEPAGAGEASDGVQNFLWLFEKTSSSDDPENRDDSREVAVYQLVKVEKLETAASDGANLKLTYQRIF